VAVDKERVLNISRDNGGVLYNHLRDVRYDVDASTSG
jgi:hypothetical protein